MNAKRIVLIGFLAVGLGLFFLVGSRSPKTDALNDQGVVSIEFVKSWTPEPEQGPADQKTASKQSETDGFPDVADTHWASSTTMSYSKQRQVLDAIGDLGAYRNLNFEREDSSSYLIIEYSSSKVPITINGKRQMIRFQTLPLSALTSSRRKAVLKVLEQPKSATNL
jgi:hypothetical protein